MTDVEQILKQAERLSPEARLLLISLLQAADLPHVRARPRRAWREIAGTAPDLTQGDDVQDWISDSRRIADRERRGEVLR